MYAKQLPLFIIEEEEEITNTEEWGTFKDSLRAPIHSWFTYPAGFSYKAVETSLKNNHITPGKVVYDPFMGSGTTNVTAKKLGVNSYGVEAHPFVFKVAKVKLNWDINRRAVIDAISKIETMVRKARNHFSGDLHDYLQTEFPELVLKCYEDKTLLDLLFLRNALSEGDFAPDVTDFLFVGLTNILRQVSTAATGWPYVAPKKQKSTSLNKDALLEFSRQIWQMLDDIEITVNEAEQDYQWSFHKIFNADSRNTTAQIPEESVDFVFTSPPYLNNFDYADRTRLELYFFGEAKTWGDITKNVRAKLITSATTQISRNDPKYNLSKNLQKASPKIFGFLSDAVSKLSQIRLTKGGKKSYDHLVSGYFNDMFLIISDVFRVLKPGHRAIFVLGDSAPYGVHIPTDELIGQIGVDIGFDRYTIDVLRTRGGKWKDNPQRHNVLLRESIVTLTKN
ncbi:MAG: hypothetical protein JW953_04680 [Anaerolineae bacterium]|nr:hypothetical protein [Anaerolineae bacterium]